MEEKSKTSTLNSTKDTLDIDKDQINLTWRKGKRKRDDLLKKSFSKESQPQNQDELVKFQNDEYQMEFELNSELRRLTKFNQSNNIKSESS